MVMIKNLNTVFTLVFFLISKIVFAFQPSMPPVTDVDDDGVPAIPEYGFIVLLLLGAFLGIWYLNKHRQNNLK